MRQIPLTITSFILILFIASCRDENSAAGGKWVTSSFRTIQTDTCTVKLSTILSDSLATSGDSVCQIGHRNDDLWGDIDASFYTEYEVPTISFNESSDYRFDSITIRFYTSGNYLGDTLASQRIHLHTLKENVSLNEGYLYNSSSIRYSTEPLASVSITPTPGQKYQKTEIRLPDTWGETWFNMMLDESKYMESQEYFRDYFKGLAFIPDINGNCINGFQVNDSSLCITIHYHLTETEATEQTITFTPSSTLTFNKVSCNRSSTPFAALKPGTGYALSSGETTHQAYLQGMTGMYLAIDFPHLNNLRGEGELVSIESAVLQLYPVRGTYDGFYPLPETLTLYTANEDNITESVITDIAGTSVQTGSLVTDNIMYEETYYSFDITSFLQSNLGTVGYNRRLLQLMLPDNLFFTTLKGVVFGDASHPTNKNNVKLTILYKTYNQ